MDGECETNITPFPELPNEILFKILNKLDNRSLLSCRRVNQDWCAASSTILQSRPNVFVRLFCSPVSQGKKSPASFIECFKESQKFCHPVPFVNFLVKGCGGKISNCPDIERFFALTEQSKDSPASDSDSDSGSALQIKCLQFDEIRSNRIELNILEKLIFERTPELKILGVQFCKYPGFESGQLVAHDSGTTCFNDSTWNLADRKLLSLHVLQLVQICGTAEVDFCTKILRAAPNIQKIEGLRPGEIHGFPYRVYQPEHFQLLVHTKKLHLVNQCDFKMDTTILQSGILDQVDFSQFQPKSLYLSGAFFVSSEEKKAGFEKLLWTIKDSVEELHTRNGLDFLEIDSLPRFSKLNQLHLNVQKPFAIFPRRFQPLPNFEDNFADFSRVAPRIWTNMTRLTILGLCKIPWKNVKFMDQLEAGFTGFSIETFQQLRTAAPKNRPRMENVDHLRINPSIIQMTELKNLVLQGNKSQAPAPDTILSFKYAFDLIPGMTVEIS